jgi:hypothetical protein
MPAPRLLVTPQPEPLPAARTDWFTNGQIWEVPNEYNKAVSDGLYRYLDICGPERRDSFIAQVEEAVEFLSGPNRAHIAAAKRMSFVLATLEAGLDAYPVNFAVNEDLKQLMGNYATDPTETGWWDETRPLLARVIVHTYQLKCQERLAA